MATPAQWPQTILIDRDCAQMMALFTNLCWEAALLPVRQRFHYVGRALPVDILQAILQGAEACRLEKPHPFREFAHSVAIQVRAQIYRDAEQPRVQAHVCKWTNAVGLGLMFEHLRRQGVVAKVPQNPFSTWEMRLYLFTALDRCIGGTGHRRPRDRRRCL